MDIKNNTSTIFSYFSEMPDFRINRKKQYLLTDIIAITIAGVLCGMESYNIEDFAQFRQDWFKTFLPFPNGILYHDTLKRVFLNMDPIKFEACYRNCVNAIRENHPEQLISIDRKTVRGAKSHGNKSPIHIVSAWASDSNMVMGQVKVDEKSNEITAISELLNTLFIKGNIINIDSMSRQQDIATCIIKAERDYLLAVKNNQPTLSQNLEDFFRFLKIADYNENIDIGHGRIQTGK